MNIPPLQQDRNLSKYLPADKDVEFFFSKGEHYNLLTTLSHKFNNTTLYDIGTYLGQSAIALSSNSTNRVISYDIVYVDSPSRVSRPENVEFRIGNFYYDPVVLSSPLIMFDIDPHNGSDEESFVSNLVRNNYKGIVVFDDIHLNDGMEYFWKTIKQEKHDLTDIGHWSGTGMVIFN